MRLVRLRFRSAMLNTAVARLMIGTIGCTAATAVATAPAASQAAVFAASKV